MRSVANARRPWLLLVLGIAVAAAAAGGVALYSGDQPAAIPGLSVVQRPRGFLYRATTPRFEAELQGADAASRAEAADAFASAELQAGVYRYRAALKEYRRSLKASRTLSADLNAGLVALQLGELADAEAHFRNGLELAGEGRSSDFEAAFQLALGEVFGQQGQAHMALAAARQALDVAGAERDLLLEAAALGQMGGLQTAQGKFGEALCGTPAGAGAQPPT